MLSGYGLYRVTPGPQACEDGGFRPSTSRAYTYFYITDASNGVPATSIRPVEVVDEQAEGMYHCRTYKIYPHQDGEHIISKSVERIEGVDLYRLPILLFPEDKLTHLSGLEGITLDTKN